MTACRAVMHLPRLLRLATGHPGAWAAAELARTAGQCGRRPAPGNGAGSCALRAGDMAGRRAGRPRAPSGLPL